MGIPYRIIQIVTRKFEQHPDLLVGGSNAQVVSEYNFAVSVAEHRIRCISKFVFLQGENTLLELELVCIFDVEHGAFNDLKKEGELIVPVEFLRYMATICVGTARGDIHARTEGTTLSNIILPPINLVEAIKEPFVLKSVQ
jgi:hypothetical protein